MFGNNNILCVPSVWFLREWLRQNNFKAFWPRQGLTSRRKTTFQISGCPTGLIQFYFLVYVVSGDGRKGSGACLTEI